MHCRILWSLLACCQAQTTACPTVDNVTFVSIDSSGDCYALIDTPMTWDDANEFCRTHKSHLLAVDRKSEADEIVEWLEELNCKCHKI